MGRKWVFSTNPAVKPCNESITQWGSVSETVSERKKGTIGKTKQDCLKIGFQNVKNLGWGWDLYFNNTGSKIE